MESPCVTNETYFDRLHHFHSIPQLCWKVSNHGNSLRWIRAAVCENNISMVCKYVADLASHSCHRDCANCHGPIEIESRWFSGFVLWLHNDISSIRLMLFHKFSSWGRIYYHMWTIFAIHRPIYIFRKFNHLNLCDIDISAIKLVVVVVFLPYVTPSSHARALCVRVLLCALFWFCKFLTMCNSLPILTMFI